MHQTVAQREWIFVLQRNDKPSKLTRRTPTIATSNKAQNQTQEDSVWLCVEDSLFERKEKAERFHKRRNKPNHLMIVAFPFYEHSMDGFSVPHTLSRSLPFWKQIEQTKERLVHEAVLTVSFPLSVRRALRKTFYGVKKRERERDSFRWGSKRDNEQTNYLRYSRSLKTLRRHVAARW